MPHFAGEASNHPPTDQRLPDRADRCHYLIEYRPSDIEREHSRTDENADGHLWALEQQRRQRHPGWRPDRRGNPLHLQESQTQPHGYGIDNRYRSDMGDFVYPPLLATAPHLFPSAGGSKNRDASEDAALKVSAILNGTASLGIRASIH